MIYLEVVQAKNGQWFPRIRSGNREKWYTGETHKRKADAERSLRRLMEAVIGDALTLRMERPVTVTPKGKR